MILKKGYILGGRYEIIQKIGAGGMSVVYKAKCNHLKRIVAIKVLREEFVEDNDFIKKFEAEAQAVAGLSHSNIVNIYDVGKDGDIYYIVMEYMDGKNLKEIIQKVQNMDTNVALTIAYNIAEALVYAHKNGIVHRDLKSKNILINEDGIVKVADFGIAKATTTSTISLTSNAIGSVHYFSPEQAKGEAVDGRSDIYSLGIIMYELFTKKLPFDGDSPVTVALKHITDSVTNPSLVNKNLSESIDYIVIKSTQKEKIDRYQSAEELLDDIEAVMEGIDITKKKDRNPSTANEVVDFAKILKESDDVENEKDLKVSKIPEEDMDEYESNEKDDNVKKKYFGIEDEYKVREKGDDKKGDLEIVQKEVLDDKEKSMDKLNDKENQEPRDDDKKVVVTAVVTSLIIIGIIIGCMIKGILYFNDNKLVEVPDLFSEIYDDAVKDLKEKGLKLEISDEEPSDKYPEGTIIEQNIQPGEMVAKNSVIEVVVSKGKVALTMPDLQARTLEEAQKVLKKYNVSITTVLKEDDSLDKGYIISTIPAYGSTIKYGQTVTLVISSGKKNTENRVPSLIGLTEEEARTRLSQAGLVLGNVNYKSGNSKDARISSQNPSSNTIFNAGDKVDIVLTKSATNSSDDNNDHSEVAVQTKITTVEISPNIELDKENYKVEVVIQDSKGTRTLYRKNHVASDFPFSKNFNVEVGSMVAIYINDVLQTEYNVR